MLFSGHHDPGVHDDVNVLLLVMLISVTWLSATCWVSPTIKLLFIRFYKVFVDPKTLRTLAGLVEFSDKLLIWGGYYLDLCLKSHIRVILILIGRKLNFFLIPFLTFYHGNFQTFTKVQPLYAYHSGSKMFSIGPILFYE